MELKLDGKVAIVTGVTANITRAITAHWTPKPKSGV